MASSSVTRGSTLRWTGLPLMFSVIGTEPGPVTLAGAGAAVASLSNNPVPTLPTPIPPINPRRLTPAFGFEGFPGSFRELTRHLTFVPFFVKEKSSQLYQKRKQLESRVCWSAEASAGMILHRFRRRYDT